MSEMKEKLHTGELYLPGDESIMKEQMAYQDRLCEYNLTKPSETKKRERMLREMLAECGESVYVEAPFYANFGGHHCHFGNFVYANYHLTCVDDTHIYVGDYTMFGPNVTVATAGHPILPELREKLYQYNMPVHIGRCCWIGAGGGDPSGRNDRGLYGDRRGQCRDKGHSGKRCRGRESVPCAAGDRGA